MLSDAIVINEDRITANKASAAPNSPSIAVRRVDLSPSKINNLATFSSSVPIAAGIEAIKESMW